MTGERFGPYVLDGVIGRGGMGEVLRARDTRKNNRVVALKRMPAALAADRTFQARFRRESEIAASLQDLHVIPIHDYGEIDGQLFIDMALIDGVDLATLIRRHAGGLPVERAVGIVAQVAGALDTAHARGLVHRDVKPSNVLIRDDNGTDFAYLIDFGIASGGGGGSITATGATVGTLAYMAPERLEGTGDHRADVYALTCVLFEALTGRPPFPGNDVLTLLRAHVSTPPPWISQTRPDLPSGLDAVVARGMAKDPGERFARAGHLAGAARAALRTGGPPPLRPPGRVPRTLVGPHVTPGGNIPPTGGWPGLAPQDPGYRWTPPPPPVTRVRRRGWVIGGIAAVALLAVVAVVAFLAVPRPQPTVTTRPPTLLGKPIPVGTSPNRLTVSPDGSRVFVANYGSNDVSVIDTARPDATAATIPVGTSPAAVTVSPDGTRLYVTNYDANTVSVIDTAQPTAAAATIPVGTNPQYPAVSPDGAVVYVSNYGSGTVSVIDVDRPADLTTITVGANPETVAFSPDGSRAYVSNYGSDTVSVIDTARPTDPPVTIGVGDAPAGVAVSPDGTRVYVVNNESDSVSVIDTANPRAAPVTIPVGSKPIAVDIAPDGRAYVTNSDSGTVSVIDTAQPDKAPTTIPVPRPFGLAVTPDGTRVYVTSGSDSVVVIDTGSR